MSFGRMQPTARRSKPLIRKTKLAWPHKQVKVSAEVGTGCGWRISARPKVGTKSNDAPIRQSGLVAFAARNGAVGCRRGAALTGFAATLKCTRQDLRHLCQTIRGLPCGARSIDRDDRAQQRAADCTMGGRAGHHCGQGFAQIMHSTAAQCRHPQRPKCARLGNRRFQHLHGRLTGTT